MQSLLDIWSEGLYIAHVPGMLLLHYPAIYLSISLYPHYFCVNTPLLLGTSSLLLLGSYSVAIRRALAKAFERIKSLISNKCSDNDNTNMKLFIIMSESSRKPKLINHTPQEMHVCKKFSPKKYCMQEFNQL